MEFQQSEQMNWQEEFKRMKRWYRRIDRGLDSDREDFLIAFLQCCYHFHYWLVKDGVVKNYKEVNDYINNNEALKLCADICNFSKHGNAKRTSRTDSNTAVVGQKILLMPHSGSSYTVSVLKITNKGTERYDAFQIGKDCMDAWAQLLISKKIEIPVLMEEVVFENSEKWEPEWKPDDLQLYELEKEKIRTIIKKANEFELELYKNPSQEKTLEEFKQISTGNQGYEQNVVSRVNSARERKIQIDSESANHDVNIKNIKIYGTIGDSAEVKTLETSYWKWPNGDPFQQRDRRHTYKLIKVGVQWKIQEENMSAWMDHAGI